MAADHSDQDFDPVAKLFKAAADGDPEAIEELFKNNETLKSSINAVNQAGQTAVHCAAEGGHANVIRLLHYLEADLNVQDKRGRTALHIACLGRQVQLALLLLHLECQTNRVDEVGETALHIACRDNLPTVVQMLCAHNCDVDKKTKEGLTALHLAAKQGHVEVVRSLLLAGADIDEYTADNAQAEQLARAQGHREIADLLSNLSASIMRDRREAVARQLLPTQKMLPRVRINILGNSGVGKTTLIESLKCGFIRSLFRRSGSSMLQASEKASLDSFSLSEMNPSIYGNNYRQPSNVQYTRGIDVQQTSISVAGDVSFWEFPGFEPYYAVYDRFLGDPNAFYVVVTSMQSSATERRKQLDFWLNTIRTRMIPVEPIGYRGNKLWAPRVAIIVTHSDLNSSSDTNSSDSAENEKIFQQVLENFSADLLLERRMFVLDANQAMGAEMKQLRQTIADVKNFICEGLPPAIGILDATLAVLPEWRRVLSMFPVVQWSSFMEYVRVKVNMLAMEEHLRELVNQLQVMGEVQCLMRDDQELIVINPRWMCSDVIGKLMSYDCLSQGPIDGRFSLEQVRSMFTKTDPADIVVLLDALELCITTQRNGYAVHNIFCFDRSTAPHEPQAFTDKDVVGGFRVLAEYNYQLIHVFQRILHSLIRRLEVQQHRFPAESDSQGTSVEHWSTGAKIIRGNLTATVRLLPDGNQIVAVFVGPDNQRKQLFFFQEDVCEAIYIALEICCPALYLERAPLSVASLRAAKLSTEPISVYRTRDIVVSQLAGIKTVHLDNNNAVVEQLSDLVAFGDSEVFSHLRPGIDQHIEAMPLYARYRLAALLDVDNEGSDWLALSKALELPIDSDMVQNNGNHVFSPTDKLIVEWSRNLAEKATIKEYHKRLTTINRPDAVDILLNYSPLYRYFRNDDK